MITTHIKLPVSLSRCQDEMNVKKSGHRRLKVKKDQL